MRLNEQQLNDYNTNGFLILPDFVSREACEKLKHRASELVETFDPSEVVSIFSAREQMRTSDDYFLTSGDKIRFFFEENAFDERGNLKQSKELSINKIGHALHELDDVFREFSNADDLKDLIASLNFEKPFLIQSMYIFKQPNIGGEVTCHQDATFLYTEPMSVTGFWFALEGATKENGCLWAIAGGHKQGLKSRFVRDEEKGGTKFIHHDKTEWDLEKLIPLEVEAGTLILLHGLLPHLSYENRSTKSRHAYTMHVIDAACDYPKDNWLHCRLPIV
jgi:phytanoyl-CoA hydroxylase